MNGVLEDALRSHAYHVGINLVLCYSGSMFGYNGSPVFWTKDEGRFSDSILFPSEQEGCIAYINEILSMEETIDGSNERVRSFVNLYRTDPCLLYEDRFNAVLMIRSLEMDDAGLYDLHLENQRGFVLADGGWLLNSISQ